jgi:hypothetical protein
MTEKEPRHLESPERHSSWPVVNVTDLMLNKITNKPQTLQTKILIMEHHKRNFHTNLL